MVENKKKAVKEKLPPLPKKIRVLVSIGTAERAFQPGKSYKVGPEVSEASARSYLKAGLAEIDAAAEGPSETK